MNHKLLHISSRKKTSSSKSNSDFVVNLNNNNNIQIVKSVIIKQVTFPHVFYNIHDDNNSFTYKIATVPTTVVIANGQYGISDLIIALQTAAAAVGLAITPNPINQKLDFTSTTDIEYLPLPENTMGDVLGIVNGSGADVAAFSASGIPDLSGVKNIMIKSEILGQSNLINSEQKVQNVLGVVPITTEFLGIQHYITQHDSIDDVDSLSQRHGKNLQTIDIQLLDQIDSRLLDLQNHHVEIILKVFY